MDLVQTGGNVREFASAGNFGLAPESLVWRWRLESNAGADDGNSVFVDHGNGNAARFLLAMREQHQQSKHRDYAGARAHVKLWLLSRRLARSRDFLSVRTRDPTVERLQIIW
jgi:hypothetical protein